LSGHFIRPYFKGAEVVLEIGPGAGRWTEYLLQESRQLIGVDISEQCVTECRRRFASHPNATFVVGSGADLQTVETRSIARIWSFDVFVHVNREDFASYVAEFARVLIPGGIGVLHHGAFGGSRGGWRSDVTLADVQGFLKQYNLETLSEITAWIDDGVEHAAGLYGDVITVFRSPPVPTGRTERAQGTRSVSPRGPRLHQ